MTALGSRVGVFHPSTQHSWQTALAFQQADRLAWYATSVFYDPARWPYRIETYLPVSLSKRINREFKRRYHRLLDPANVRHIGYWQWVQSAAHRLNAQAATRFACAYGNSRFGERVIALIERDPVDTLWGYDTSSLEVFRWARQRGIYCVLDQTLGHRLSMDRVMLAERARNPEFFDESSFRPSSTAEIARQNEEIALADLIVVGSQSCAATLIENGCPTNKIWKISYGYDETLFPPERPQRAPLADRPVNFVFIGALNPRKGIASLLKAFARVSPARATLTLVGDLQISRGTFDRYRSMVTHVGSVPRNEVAAHFARADCFVFPSLFEGSALVLHEAIASGLGIIQSQSAGEGALAGHNGVIIKSVDTDTVEQALTRTIEAKPELIQWQNESWSLREDRTWSRYRSEVASMSLPLRAAPE